MPDRVGQQLGNYRLVKLLGKGGFAEVYLGQHVHLATKQAAIKILYLTGIDARKFQKEAETTESLVHPHIVRLLDFDIEEGIPFLVLDYAPGGSLRSLHPKGSIVPLARVTSYLKEIAPALQYAHNKHILHRDIKPDNMLIGRGGELLVSDFGIAVLTQTERTSLSSVYDIGGTPYYMAPETYGGRPVKESDQYALAVMAYEWLCGSVPFTEGNFIQLGYQHAMETVPRLREKNPVIPSEVEAVVLKALSKEPKDRFASVKTFVKAFEQSCIPTLLPEPSQRDQRGSDNQTLSIDQDETEAKVTPRSVPPGVTPPSKPTSEAPLSWGVREALPLSASSSGNIRSDIPPAQSLEGTRVPARRISRRNVLIGLGAVAAVGIGGTVWWDLSRRSRGSSGASSLTPTHEPTATRVPLGTTLYTYREHRDSVYSVAWSPNGKYIASGSTDNTVQVWDATTGATHVTYTRHTDYVYSVAWSPNGKYIASGSRDNTVQVWDATTGARRLTYKGHSVTVWSVAWSPNVREIASGSWDRTVHVWDATTGTTHVTYTRHTDYVYSVAWSPNGKYIASGSRDNTVQVWDATTGIMPVTYKGHSSSVYSVAWSPDGKEIASGSTDNTVQVWDIATGTKRITYKGHSSGVFSVAWSPDGKEIASGSDDRTVKVWDAATGTRRINYTGHTNGVVSVAWSPNGKFIASGSWDNTVQVWQAV